MSDRKRINISIRPALLAEIEGFVRAGRYKGVCAFVVALLEEYSRFAKELRARPERPKTLSDEIREMFAGLAEEEPERLNDKNKGNNQPRPP